MALLAEKYRSRAWQYLKRVRWRGVATKVWHCSLKIWEKGVATKVLHYLLKCC